jgi:predicted AAA+ superfamily ATPase
MELSHNDLGQLWENFLVTERMKKCAYQNIYGSFYFWRTYDGRELDLVEEREGNLAGYEFKWSDKKRKNPPADWLKGCKHATVTTINWQNYLDYIL